MIFALKRLAGIANSRFRRGFYSDICFQALSWYSEFAFSPWFISWYLLSSTNFTVWNMCSKPHVIPGVFEHLFWFKVSSRMCLWCCYVRAGGTWGVGAVMWTCWISQRDQLRSRSCGLAVLQCVINRKILPYILKNVYTKLPIALRMGLLLVCISNNRYIYT